MLSERYRTDYVGEFVITNTRWANGKKIQEREWVPNPISNTHLSSRAVVLDDGESRKSIRLSAIRDHKGGLLGKKKLQLYGVGSLDAEIFPDFMVVLDEPTLQLVMDNHCSERFPTYTTTSYCLKYPGNFYMIPHNFRSHPTAVAAYLAAFDGHTEIFMIGCDMPPLQTSAYAKFIAAMREVFTTYNRVRFYSVNDRHDIPVEWKSCSNVQWMKYRQFITHCDI